MSFKKGDKVVFKMGRQAATVHSVNGTRAMLNMRDDLGGFMQEAHVDHLEHVFEYEELQAQEWGDDGVSEPHALGNTLCIYEDKRTGLAVLDKRKYEAWITENGL